MEALLVNHFKDLLAESPDNRMEATQRITQYIPKLITNDQNMALMRAVSKEEVEK